MTPEEKAEQAWGKYQKAMPLRGPMAGALHDAYTEGYIAAARASQPRIQKLEAVATYCEHVPNCVGRRNQDGQCDCGLHEALDALDAYLAKREGAG